eukprot:scaffold704_cov347-Prasinococcus_capsulatus_cf.AAC.35
MAPASSCSSATLTLALRPSTREIYPKLIIRSSARSLVVRRDLQGTMSVPDSPWLGCCARRGHTCAGARGPASRRRRRSSREPRRAAARAEDACSPGLRPGAPPPSQRGASFGRCCSTPAGRQKGRGPQR